jgi:hypothetical protein
VIKISGLYEDWTVVDTVNKYILDALSNPCFNPLHSDGRIFCQTNKQVRHLHNCPQVNIKNLKSPNNPSHESVVLESFTKPSRSCLLYLSLYCWFNWLIWQESLTSSWIGLSKYTYLLKHNMVISLTDTSIIPMVLSKWLATFLFVYTYNISMVILFRCSLIYLFLFDFRRASTPKSWLVSSHNT